MDDNQIEKLRHLLNEASTENEKKILERKVQLLEKNAIVQQYSKLKAELAKKTSISRDDLILEFLKSIPVEETSKIYYKYPQKTALYGYKYENIENPNDVYYMASYKNIYLFELYNHVIHSSLKPGVSMQKCEEELKKIRLMYVNKLLENSSNNAIEFIKEGGKIK